MVNRRSRIYIILPAHNEEKNIGRVLKEYRAFFMHPACRFHVVINNSSDDTFARAHALAQSDARIIISNLPEVTGKGGAILYGLREAQNRKFDTIGFVDSDGSVRAGELNKLVEKLEHQADGIVIGSRWLPGSKIIIPQSKYRQLLSRFFNNVVRLLFRFPYRDTQCGAKVMTRDTYVTLLPLLKEKGFAFDVELLWRAKKLRIPVLEVPIAWVNSSDSSVKPFRMSGSLLRSLLRIRRAQS